MKVKYIMFDQFNYPSRAHYNDSGADVYAGKDYIVKAHSALAIPTGIGLELPDGYDAVVHSKSGLSAKGIICANAPIDSGYRGEINAIVVNTTENDYLFKKGEKIGQIVVRPVVYVEFVKDLGKERNKGAFGSTGK